MMASWTSQLFVLAQTVKPGAEQAAEPSLMSPWVMGALVVLMILVPFGLGTMIARALKLKDLAMRIGVVLLTLELGLAPFVSQYVIGAAEKSRYDAKHEEWKKKQAYREKITDEGIKELKTAIPGVEVLLQEEGDGQKPKAN